MSAAEHQLADDKALRDAALAVFQADLRFIKEDLAARGVGGRIADRLGDSALDMVDDAVDYAESNKGQIGAAVAGRGDLVCPGADPQRLGRPVRPGRRRSGTGRRRGSFGRRLIFNGEIT